MQGTMPLDEILRLPSVDSDGISFGRSDEEENWTVESAIENKDIDDEYHEAIKESMEENGINLVPIHIDKASAILSQYMQYSFYRIPDWLDADKQLMLGNGNHRVKIAKELGLKEMRYSTDINDTGWGDEEMSLVTLPDGGKDQVSYY